MEAPQVNALPGPGFPERGVSKPFLQRARRYVPEAVRAGGAVSSRFSSALTARKQPGMTCEGRSVAACQGHLLIDTDLAVARHVTCRRFCPTTSECTPPAWSEGRVDTGDELGAARGCRVPPCPASFGARTSGRPARRGDSKGGEALTRGASEALILVSVNVGVRWQERGQQGPLGAHKRVNFDSF